MQMNETYTEVNNHIYNGILQTTAPGGSMFDMSIIYESNTYPVTSQHLSVGIPQQQTNVSHAIPHVSNYNI
jgi:hypothetical protein